MINLKKILIVLLSILLVFPVTVFGIEEVNSENETVVEKNDDSLLDEDEILDNIEELEKEKVLEDFSNEVRELEVTDDNTNGEVNDVEDDIEISEPKENALEVPQNGVPLVIIRVDESEEAIKTARDKDPENEYGTIEEMNSSSHHSVRSVGTMEIIVPDDFESEYDLTNSPIGEQKLAYVRGRGNSTWIISDKKPYKVKYDKKQDVLGMGKDKEWGLLANSFDPTLVHNAVAEWIGEEMDMEFTPKMVPVDLVMIGSLSGSKYLGSYYLSELTDIGKNRVEINELDEDDKDDITGGYLVSLYYEDQDFNEPENTVFETEYSNVKFINENPYFGEGELTAEQEAQRTYIKDYFNQVDDLIMNNEVIDENIHNEISNLLDLKSTADFWLVQEFFVNFDGFKTSSNYLYKKENDKLYFGPLWDFDLMLYMIDSDEPSHVRGFNRSLPFPWLDNLRSNDPKFINLLKDEWSVMNEKLIELTKEKGVLDKLKERQRKSWDANYELWKDGNYYGNDTTIDEEFEKLRKIIDNRRNWFNENIDSIGAINSTVSYEVDGEIVRVDTVRTGSILEEINLNPNKKGLLFDGWVAKETGERYDIIFKDVVLVPNYINPGEIDEEIVFFLSRYEDWVSIYDEEYNNSLKIFPEDYYDLIVKNVNWSSSNENVAYVEDGTIKLNSVGDVVISATLFNGDSKSFLLHVYNEDIETIDEPEYFTIESDSYTVEVGEVIQLVTNMVPNKPVSSWYYIDREISDKDVIEVDYSDCYTVMGLKEGVATVTLEIYSSFSDRKYGTKTVTINVVKKVEEKIEELEDESIKVPGTSVQTNNVVKTSNSNNSALNNYEKEIEDSNIIEVLFDEESELNSNEENVILNNDNVVTNETNDGNKKEAPSSLVLVLTTLAFIGIVVFLVSSRLSKKK